MKLIHKIALPALLAFSFYDACMEDRESVKKYFLDRLKIECPDGTGLIDGTDLLTAAMQYMALINQEIKFLSSINNLSPREGQGKQDGSQQSSN